MADSPDEKQNEDSGADIGDDDGSINDPLTRTDVEAPRAPSGGNPEA